MSAVNYGGSCEIIDKIEKAYSPQSTPKFAAVRLTSCAILQNGQDARSTKDKFSCATGILPVHKRLTDNGAT
ncbi:MULTISPECIES: hypothetical protein [unclassified Microcoleus]|uniref:hypothetical protein n=1 Tax=unclassified Microcoleus TaxID=2642155 RepID=UPI002FD70DD6